METPISPKVVSGALGGAVSTILVWIVGAFGVDVPGEVGAALAVIVTFGVSWLTKDPLRDAGQAAVTVAQAAPETSLGDVPAVAEQTIETDGTDAP